MIENLLQEIRKFSPLERIDSLNELLEQKPTKEEREKILEEIKKTELEIQQLKLWKAIGEIPQQRVIQEETPEKPRPVRREENLEEIASVPVKKEENNNNKIENMYSVSSKEESKYMPETDRGEQKLYSEESYTSPKSGEPESKEDELTNQYAPKPKKEKERKEDLNNREKSVLEKMKDYRK